MAKKRKRTSSKKCSKPTKKGHLIRNSILAVIVLLIAVGFALATGKVPSEILELLPPDLQKIVKIFIPKPPTPDVPEGTPRPLSKISGNSTIGSFNKSKRLLKEMHIEAGQMITFYCGSTFNGEKKIDHSNSGFKFYKDEKRSNRLEWEHVVPAHAFGQSFIEWREGHEECVDSKKKRFKGRKCAEKMNMTYRYMQADLYNLRPAIGEVNGRRSNYSFSMIEGEKRIFGSCNMEIESSKAEPPDHRFGDIARIYMYMESAYSGRGIISDKNEKLFVAWNKMDPVDQWECKRNRLIEKIQGNENTIVKQACDAAGL